ncbi:hypothetical protein [Brotaphodocola sp.]|uniref:hypothetical protein n=1 Tax=Brotaphodocola sp. TaxID=3073577 RepID=UPI003D7E271B
MGERKEKRGSGKSHKKTSIKIKQIPKKISLFFRGSPLIIENNAKLIQIYFVLADAKFIYQKHIKIAKRRALWLLFW